MKYKKIQKILKNSLPLEKIQIIGKENNIRVIAIGNIFLNLSSLKRQQLIYSPLMPYFENNKIHSISIESYTPLEWKKKNQKK